MTTGITSDDIAESNGSSLGPGYFAARRIMERLMKDADQFDWSPIIKKAQDNFYEGLLSAVEGSLVYDAESNVQGHIRQMVDDTVRAILIGERWALERYPLAKYYDGASLRRLILRRAGTELLALHDAEDQWGNTRERQNNTVWDDERDACLREMYRHWHREEEL